jgi:DNA-binding response OmpR family regulator
VDGSTTRAGEGTGIGLAHSLELVKLMGGVISVESELGKGSVFHLSLPVRQSAVGSGQSGSSAVRQSSVRQFDSPQSGSPQFDSPAVLQQDINHSATDSQDWRSRSEFGTRSGELKTGELPTLLIIEDNPDVVFYLKTCLAGEYQLDVALNGRIGIEKALETIPDLIISDVMMPEKNGYEVCETLKKDERTSHIPIILLTAKADVASKITGLRRGADAYLAKPFDKEELLVRLEMLAELRKRLRERYASLQPEVGSLQTGQGIEFEMEDAFIQKVRMIVAEHYEDEGFTLPQLCQKVGMSRSQLFRKMKAIMDTSPSDFIRKYRLDKAKSLLENEAITVAEAAYQTGFKDPSYFSKLYQEEFGVAPSMSRK